jgi:hypothetical protein
MKYKNYEIIKADERNWQLLRHDTGTATRDMKAPKTGQIVHKFGDTYEKTVEKGFFGTFQSALIAMIDDLVGRDCETLQDVAKQVQQLRSEIAALTQIKTK